MSCCFTASCPCHLTVRAILCSLAFVLLLSPLCAPPYHSFPPCTPCCPMLRQTIMSTPGVSVALDPTLEFIKTMLERVRSRGGDVPLRQRRRWAPLHIGLGILQDTCEGRQPMLIFCRILWCKFRATIDLLLSSGRPVSPVSFNYFGQHKRS